MRYLDYPERQVFGSQNLPCFFYAVDKNTPTLQHAVSLASAL